MRGLLLSRLCPEYNHPKPQRWRTRRWTPRLIYMRRCAASAFDELRSLGHLVTNLLR